MKLEDLPQLVLLDILSRLTTRSLCCIRCICKRWYSLTGDVWLQRMRMARSSTIKDEALILTWWSHSREWIDDPEADDMENWTTELWLMTEHCTSPKPLVSFPGHYHIQQSCEGLLCTVKRDGSMLEVIVSSPLGGWHLTVPPPIVKSCCHDYSNIDLGFNSSIQKYKIVCVFHREIDDPNKCRSLGAQVYTIGTASWSSWRDITCPPTVAIVEWKNSVYAGGARHWLVDYHRSSNGLETMVISFDFEKEEFKTLPRQDFFSVANCHRFNLVDVRGCLGMAMVRILAASTHIEIWRLKDYERNEWVSEKQC